MTRCLHPNTHIVWTKFSAYGSEYLKPQLRNFCDDCGELVGGALKHSLATSETPTLSRDEATRAERIRNEYWRQRDIEKQRQAQQWQADHEAYLQTREWADKRKLILKRANGICEGCGKAPAEQVHHMTYQIGAMSFCGSCARSVVLVT